MLVVITVPVFRHHHRDLFQRIALREDFRMGDVVIIGDTSVLCHLLVIGREEDMGLIVVTEIRAVHRIVKMRSALTGIVATGIEIVDIESYTQPLSGIHTKLGYKMVLTVHTVTATVITQIGKWRQRIGKMKLCRILHKKVVRLYKEEILTGRPVGINTVDARCTVITRRIVFTSQT